MNYFLILMMAITMASYQYYNYIRGFISDKNEVGTIEENQLRYQINCMKRRQAKLLGDNNTSKTKVPINATLSTSKEDCLVDSSMFSRKFCSDTSGTLIATNTTSGEACFADKNSIQYVITFLDTPITKDFYGLMIKENAAFVSDSGEFVGSEGASGMSKKVIAGLKELGLDLTNLPMVVFAVKTSELEEIIQKNENNKNMNEQETLKFCEVPPERPTTACLAGWQYIGDACNWYCPSATKSMINALAMQKGCGKHERVILQSSLAGVYDCVKDYDDANKVCGEMGRFAEWSEAGRTFVCAEKRKSEAGCSICQIPKIMPDGKWACSQPSSDSASISFDTGSGTATMLKYQWNNEGNSDVQAIKIAGCLKDCDMKNATLIWDASQRLWKCHSCKPNQQFDLKTGTCKTIECAGSLIYDEELGRCVPVKWCKVSSADKARGIFVGNSKGVCPGPSKEQNIATSTGSTSSVVKEEVSTLYRKTYNPIDKCFYCRINIPIPIIENGAKLKLPEIFNDLIDMISSIKLISSANAQETIDNSGYQDAIDGEKFTIQPNLYPPYAIGNNPMYLDSTIFKNTSEKEIGYCNQETDFPANSTVGSPVCINCATAGNRSQCSTASRTIIEDKDNARYNVIAGYQVSNGFSSGLGGDMKNIEATWTNSGECFFTCNSTNVNCGVKKGFKRLFRNSNVNKSAECDSKYNFLAVNSGTGAGFDITAGGWSGAFRDWADNYKSYGWSMAEVPDDLKASVGQLPDKKYSSNLNDPNQRINLCSIYIENKEYPGLYKTTTYMVDRDTGKTICVPKLSITVPPGNYDLDDDVYNGDTCASKFGTSACIGNIIEDTSKIPGLTPPGGATLTPETPVSDLIFSNSFECDIATGCKVDAQPPKACADINDSKKTIYEYIIEQAVSAGSISQPGREDINKKPEGQRGKFECPAGYRLAVTWKFDLAHTCEAKDSTCEIQILRNNCMFCEKVLFGAAPGDTLTGSEADVNVSLGLASAEGGKTGPTAETHSAAANYYLMQPDTLGVGKPSKYVWHVDPRKSVAENATTPCPEDKCVDPFSFDITGLNTPSIEEFADIAKGKGNIGLTSEKNPVGICPAGMIETKSKDRTYIACYPYNRSPSPVICPLAKEYGKGNNNILVDIGKNASSSGAIQRPGCDIGNKLAYDESTRTFICQSTGIDRNQRECRPGYELQPVLTTVKDKETNKESIAIVFKCQKLDIQFDGTLDYILTCTDALTNPNDVGLQDVKVERCLSDAYTGKKDWSGTWTSNKDDSQSTQCIMQDVKETINIDEFSRNIELKRYTSIILIGDCRICL